MELKSSLIKYLICFCIVYDNQKIMLQKIISFMFEKIVSVNVILSIVSFDVALIYSWQL